MSTEENKALVRRYYEEAVNQRKLAVVDELVTPNHLSHAYPGDPDGGRGPEGLKRTLALFTTAFPDLRVTVDDMVAQADLVVTRTTSRGTHHGELMGIAPTGKQVTFTAITIDRVRDGKIVENWLELDRLGLLQQLGVIPMPEQTQQGGA
jgi:predicted ester cyclase